MESVTQHGYLVLSDISGFTSYLAKVEIDHANEVLTDLLEAIVERFKTLLSICKLEGDAVLAYAPGSALQHGETLLELLESTYLIFRDKVEAARRRTTCTCRACQAIPTLDLKFFVHHGDYIVQNVSGIRDLVGSDVNLIHRLMKNHISEATGWKAYALFTEVGLERLAVHPEGLHALTETYEHLGEIRAYALNLRPRYEELVAARRAEVSQEAAHVVTAYDYPVPPPVVWEWLNDPQKRATYGLHHEQSFLPVLMPGGRRGVGAQTHCVHGKKVAMVETVLDWRPFDYFTVDQVSSGLTLRGTYRLRPTPSGTHLEICERGYGTPLKFLDRLITTLICTRIFPTVKILEKLAERIAEDSSHQIRESAKDSKNGR